MSKRTFQIVFFVAVNLVFGFTLLTYLKNRISDPEKYLSRIQEYPSGVVYRTEPIRIVFARDFDAKPYPLNELISDEIVKFSPKIKGNFYWIDTRTLEFQPISPLPFNETINASVNLSKVFKEDDPIWKFKFKFKTAPLTLQISNLQVYYPPLDSLQNLTIRGQLIFNDFIEIQQVQSSVRAYVNKTMVHLEVNYGINQKTYNFIIKQVTRTESQQELNLEWEFEKYRYTDHLSIPIYSQNKFGFCYKTMNYSTFKPEAALNFSDPIDLTLPLSAFIKCELVDSFQYEAQDNKLIIRPINIRQQEYRFTIQKALTSIKGNPLEADIEQIIDFSPLEPKIKIEPAPALLPLSEDHSTFAFKALCLKSVNVRVFEVYNDNILQYLQLDNLNQHSELNRVGKPVIEKTFMLENQPDYHPNQWQTYRLNLSELKVRKNGVFHIQLTFNRSNTVTNCNDDPKNSTPANWYDRYYGLKSDSLDACRDGFYGFRKAIQQSVIFTDIGLISNLSLHDSLHVFVSQLETGEPLPKAKISFYNFQQQIVATALTDEKGHAAIDNGSHVSFIKASYQNDVNFLKIDAQNMALGMNEMQQYKGLIMTPRTFYRPLDTLSVAFLASPFFPLSRWNQLMVQLTDQKQNIVFFKELAFNPNGQYAFSEVFPANVAMGEAQLTIKAGDRQFIKSLTILPHSPNHVGFTVERTEKKKDQPTELNLSALRNGIQPIKNVRVNGVMQFVKKKTELPQFEGFSIYDEHPFNWTQTYDTTFDASGNLTLPLFKANSSFWGELKLTATLVDVDGIKQAFDTVIDCATQPEYWAIKSDSTQVELLKLNPYLQLVNETTPAVVQIKSNHKTIETIRTRLHQGRLSIKPKSPLFGGQDISMLVTLGKDSKYTFRLPYPAEESLNTPSAPLSTVPTMVQHQKPEVLEANKSAKFEFTSPESQRALVFIESLNGIAQFEWLNLAKGLNRFDFIPSEAMIPKIKVSVVSVNGLMPITSKVFEIASGAKPLSPQISMPFDLVSGETADVIVSETSQQPMDYLMVLTTGHKSGSLSNLVKQHNIIPDLFGSIWHTMSTRPLTDDYYANTGTSLLSPLIDQNEYSKIYGPFSLDKAQKNRHSVKIPEYFGKAQLTIMAVNRNTRSMTTAEHEAYISRPLLIQIDAPSTVSPSEEIEIYANLYSERLANQEAVFEIENPKNLYVQTGTILPISVSEFKSTFPIRIKFKPAQGKASFKIVVRSGNYVENKQVNFDVLHYIPYEYKQQSSSILPNENWHTGFVPIGLRGTNHATMVIGNMANFAPSYYRNMLDSLWPQSCDQLLAYSFPLLYAEQSLDQVNQHEIQQVIDATLLQLKNYQNPNGSFAEWPHLNETNLWLTNYAGHFMTEALKKGYKPLPSVYNKWLLFQQRQINMATYTHPHHYVNQCYALYCLALANKPDFEQMGSLAYLTLPKQALYYLCLAYLRADKPKMAKPIFEKAVKLSDTPDPTANALYNPIITNCLAFEYYNLTEDDQKVAEVQSKLSLAQQNFSILNHFESSAILCQQYQHQSSTEQALKICYRLNKGKEVKPEATEAQYLLTQWPIEFTLPFSIDVDNKSDHPVNAVVTWFGSPDADRYVNKNNPNILFDITYTDYNEQPINPKLLKLGTPFKIKFSIKPLNQALSGYAQLKFTIPTCWAFVNDIPAQSAYYKSDRLPKNMKSEWIKLETDKPTEITYFLRANYIGSFLLAPIQLTGYLSNQFYVSTKPEWITVQ